MSEHAPPSPQQARQAIRQCLPQSRAAWLFGSAAHGGARFGAGSDIDIAVRLPHPLGGPAQLHAAEQLAQRLGHEVDLLDFDRLPTVMQVQIMHTGELLFNDSGAEHLDHCSRILTEYQHIQRWRQPMVQQLLAQLQQAQP